MTENNAIDCSTAEGPRCKNKSSVQPAESASWVEAGSLESGVELGLVLKFDSPDALREAIETGVCRFRPYGE